MKNNKNNPAKTNVFKNGLVANNRVTNNRVANDSDINNRVFIKSCNKVSCGSNVNTQDKKILFTKYNSGEEVLCTNSTSSNKSTIFNKKKNEKFYKFNAPFAKLIPKTSKNPHIALRRAIILQAIIDATNMDKSIKSVKLKLDAMKFLKVKNWYFRLICTEADLSPSYVAKISNKIIDYHLQSKKNSIKNKGSIFNHMLLKEIEKWMKR